MRSTGCRSPGSPRATSTTVAPARRASTANIAKVGVGMTTESPGPTVMVVTRRISSSAPAPGITRTAGEPVAASTAVRSRRYA